MYGWLSPWLLRRDELLGESPRTVRAVSADSDSRASGRDRSIVEPVDLSEGSGGIEVCA